MRRLLATLVLASLSFPLISGAMVVGQLSSLPACCLRNGAHRCAMMAQEQDASGPEFAGETKCPFWPKAVIPFTSAQTAPPPVRFAVETPALSTYASPARIQSVTVSRPADAVRKRGPPRIS